MGKSLKVERVWQINSNYIQTSVIGTRDKSFVLWSKGRVAEASLMSLIVQEKNMFSIKNICYINGKYYFYRQHGSSIMKKCSDKSIHHLYVWHFLYERLKQKNILAEHIKIIKTSY